MRQVNVTKRKGAMLSFWKWSTIVFALQMIGGSAVTYMTDDLGAGAFAGASVAAATAYAFRAAASSALVAFAAALTIAAVTLGATLRNAYPAAAATSFVFALLAAAAAVRLTFLAARDEEDENRAPQSRFPLLLALLPFGLGTVLGGIALLAGRSGKTT